MTGILHLKTILMKKIINKSKLFFYTVLVFMFSVNIVKANEIEQWGTTMSPSAVPTDNMHVARSYLINILGPLFLLSFVLLVFSVILYSYYSIIKNKQKRDGIEKIMLWSFVIFILSFVIYTFLLSSPILRS